MNKTELVAAMADAAEISKKEIEKYKVMRREDCNKKVLRK